MEQRKLSIVNKIKTSLLLLEHNLYLIFKAFTIFAVLKGVTTEHLIYSTSGIDTVCKYCKNH